MSSIHLQQIFPESFQILSKIVPGRLWGGFGRVLRRLVKARSILGLSGARLGVSQGHLGPSRQRLGRILGTSWNVLLASWERLGVIPGRLESFLGRLVSALVVVLVA